ncbi:MAG: flagellar basal body-associated FliL family protein [Clostridia bacterium]|nr:flagellar basal body-associated FliL family protein [Clostridia bacterium]
MEGKGSFFVLLIIVAVLTLTLAVLAGYLFFVSGSPRNTVEVSKQETTQVPKDEELQKLDLYGENGTEILTLKKTNEKQIAVITVNVELKYYKEIKGIKDPKSKLEFYTSEVKELISTYFQKMTLDEVNAPETKEKTAKELKNKINDLLNANEKEKKPIVYSVNFGKWFPQ